MTYLENNNTCNASFVKDFLLELTLWSFHDSKLHWSIWFKTLTARKLLPFLPWKYLAFIKMGNTSLLVQNRSVKRQMNLRNCQKFRTFRLYYKGSFTLVLKHIWIKCGTYHFSPIMTQWSYHKTKFLQIALSQIIEK